MSRFSSLTRVNTLHLTQRQPYSAEATIALRIRLAETVEELDDLRKSNASQLETLHKLEQQLKVARADLTLVDKSQAEMLAEVRKSVSGEQTGLLSERDRLQEELKSARMTASMQLSQINSLLLDKVDLQSQTIAQRDASLSQDSLDNAVSPPESSGLVAVLKESLKDTEGQLKQTKEQLMKARNFIRQQDKLFKEQHQSQANVSRAHVAHGFVADEHPQAANGDRQHEIESLRAELIKQKTMSSDLEQKYQNEQRLLLLAYQEAGLDNLRSQVLANGQTRARVAPVR